MKQTVIGILIEKQQCITLVSDHTFAESHMLMGIQIDQWWITTYYYACIIIHGKRPHAFIFHCRGLDVEKLFKFLHVNVDLSAHKTASTLAVAYLVHQVFHPVRAFITISSVPFIVRLLRARGIMKPLPSKQSPSGSSWKRSNQWLMWCCVLLEKATTISIFITFQI